MTEKAFLTRLGWKWFVVFFVLQMGFFLAGLAIGLRGCP